MSFDLLEFFFVLVGSHILHLAQFVQLAQGQACLAQIVQSGLAVVLAHILIGLGLTLVDFVEYNVVFIRLWVSEERRLEPQIVLWALVLHRLVVVRLRRLFRHRPVLVPWPDPAPDLQELRLRCAGLDLVWC